MFMDCSVLWRWGAAVVMCLMAASQDTPALPFTVGAPVPLDIERIDATGKTYNLLTFSKEGKVRPTILLGEASFMADQITFDELSGQITAIGNVRVTLGPQLMTGEHLEFNTETRRGILTRAVMRSSEIFVTGGKIEIREIDVRDREGVSQAYSYEVQEGTITACGYAIPHYHLESDFFRVVPGIRVWLYGAVYRVLGVPIFYFPYLTRSLRKEPFAYVFEPGVDSNKGVVLLNRFHLHYDKVLHPLARGTIYLDGYTKQGVGVGARWNYLQRPEADSYIHGYWIDQQNDFNESNAARTDTEGSRGKIAFQHFQRFGPEWTVTAKGRRLSDPDFDDDYRSEEIIRGFEEDELNSDRDAFINIARRRLNSNFRVIYKKRLEDFNILDVPEDERAPEVVYDSKRRPFTGTDIYHRLRLSAGNYASNQTTNTKNVARIDPKLVPPGINDADIHQDFQRANIVGEINRPFPFEEFNLIPFLSIEGTAYSDAQRMTHIWSRKGEHVSERLIEDYDGLMRGIASGGVEFITRREIRLDDPAAAVERRLLFEPSITLVGKLPSSDFEDMHPDQEDPTAKIPGSAIRRSRELSRIDRPGFPFIDEVDSLRDEFFGFEYRLESRYQTRRANGATRDWVVAAVSSAFDFTETEEGEERMSTIYAELFVLPFEWLTLSSYLEYEPQGSYVRSFRNAVTWMPTELITLGISYSEYQFDQHTNESEEEVSFIADLTISPRYKLRYQEFYDIDDSLTRMRRIGITRDFHDWIFDVGFRESRRESRERSVGTYFSLTLKTPKGIQGKVPGGSTIQNDSEEGFRQPSS